MNHAALRERFNVFYRLVLFIRQQNIIFAFMIKNEKGMKKGLVLEGGALRALFTAGVIDVMMENGITFDGLVGVSAGAAFGCNYKSHQPGRVIRYNKRYAHDWRYCSVRSWIKTGDLFNGEFDYHLLPDQLDVFDTKTFDASPMEYYAVCTDLETGKPVYKLLMQHGYECYEWIRASSSMPLAAKIVEVGGRKLLDGGIADSVPLRFFERKGYDKNVVVLTQPLDYIKKPNSLLPLFRLQLHRYPNFLRAVANRHEMYNEQTAYVRQREQEGAAFVIRPKEILPIKHLTHNPVLMQQVYDDGRKVMEERMNELKEFLKTT